MHNPAQAYGQTAKVVANPREHEANLLIKAAKRLQAVKDPFNPRSEEFRDALTYNRKLWSVFASTVVVDENPLPEQIKQNIANLGIFILKHTVNVQAQPAPEKLDVLININREIAAGLYSKPA